MPTQGPVVQTRLPLPHCASQKDAACTGLPLVPDWPRGPLSSAWPSFSATFGDHPRSGAFAAWKRCREKGPTCLEAGDWTWCSDKRLGGASLCFLPPPFFDDGASPSGLKPGRNKM